MRLGRPRARKLIHRASPCPGDNWRPGLEPPGHLADGEEWVGRDLADRPWPPHTCLIVEVRSRLLATSAL